ncbi:MAG TPA: 4-hydroxy-3-methylbut-2-enyl diphosphate reductase [Gaiellaceae bacterium]|jgi:4-hydroxy-3-methylbut-2-enyl diphosphate reductase
MASADRAILDVKRVLVLAPRGFCAGVERAVEAVERALAEYGPPVYVRKHIVHNEHVLRGLEAQGAIFVESEDDVPEGETLVLAAHGVPPEVHTRAAERGLLTIDATCPLVSKVHAEVRRYAAGGSHIVLIGHEGHDEIVGTRAEAPGAVVLVETVEQAQTLELDGSRAVSYVTQTTLAEDETADIIAVLEERFPTIVGPRKADICYATTNRQRAVKDALAHIDRLLVIGSKESSNSNRLVEVARRGGIPAYLIGDEGEIEPAMLADAVTIGVTAGASTPEVLVRRVCDWFRQRGVVEIREFGEVSENVSFAPPNTGRARTLPGAA